MNLAVLATIAIGLVSLPAEPTKSVKWSAEKTKNYFSDLNDLNPGDGWDRAFDQLLIDQGKGPYSVESIKSFRPITKHPTVSAGETGTKQGFQGIKIRSNFDDVLTSEDPTIADAKEKKADLTGASFSYTRDFKADSDSWAANGSILMPFAWARSTHPHTGGPIELQSYGFIPSISFDRVSNSIDNSKDVDSLTFRLGAFAKTTGGPLFSQTFRGFATYGTSFGFNKSIPTAEFEYEPAFILNRELGIGTVHALLPTLGAGEDPSNAKKTFLAYRLRAYFHAEYGRIEDKGDATAAATGGFGRGGPVLQLRLAPFFSDKLNCTVTYEYFSRFTGLATHNYLLKVEPSYDISDAVSLKASYEKGGVNPIDQQVETFFIGLGVTL